MHTDLKLAATFLKRGQLLPMQDAQGSLVLCLSGSLWLTQQADSRDIMLEAGDEARIERAGLSILSALDDSSFVLSHRPAARDAPPRVRRLHPALAVF